MTAMQEPQKYNAADGVQIRGTYLAVQVRRQDERTLELLRAHARGDMSALKTLLGERRIGRVWRQHNLIPTTGVNVMARLLTGDTTYTGEITYGAFGSGSSAFSGASTQLNTEVFRKIPASASADSGDAYIDWLIAEGDIADQTFQEFGAFIDGTASANSGQAFSLLITGGWVKAGALYISAKFSFASAT